MKKAQGRQIQVPVLPAATASASAPLPLPLLPGSHRLQTCLVECDAALLGKLGELFDLGGGQYDAASLLASYGSVVFHFTRQHAAAGVFISVAQDVIEYRFEVALLIAAHGEVAAVDCIRMNDLKEKVRRRFFNTTNSQFRSSFGARAESGQRAADHRADDFVDERHAVAFVGTKGEQGDDGVGVGGFLAILIDGAAGRELFAFAFELLDTAHGDGGGGPVDDDGVADGVHGREAPGVRVGAQRGELAAEGDDLGECCGAVGVSDVAFFRSIHHIATAPEIVEGLIDADDAHAVFVSEFHAGVHRFIGDGLAELFLRVPLLRGFEFGGFLDDRSTGNAAWAGLVAGTEVIVEVQGFDAVVSFDAVPGGLFTGFGGEFGFLGVEATLAVGGFDDVVMKSNGQDVFHGELSGWDGVKGEEKRADRIARMGGKGAEGWRRGGRLARSCGAGEGKL